MLLMMVMITVLLLMMVMITVLLLITNRNVLEALFELELEVVK